MPHQDSNTIGRIRSQGRKKSNFPANTGIPAGATFDFVADGVNYKIPADILQLALGVTGTLNQVGDVDAAPVLDKQGPANLIRSLETDSKSGISALVSATDGIRLALDAQTTGTGVPVLNTDNHIRRIRAGSDIAVAVLGDDIVVSLAGSIGLGLTTGITAFAGGGQINAVELITDFNQISTVVTAGDSLKLPTAVAETTRIIINSGSNQLDLYPNTSDKINSELINVPIAIAVNGTVTLYSYDDTNWVTI